MADLNVETVEDIRKALPSPNEFMAPETSHRVLENAVPWLRALLDDRDRLLKEQEHKDESWRSVCRDFTRRAESAESREHQLRAALDRTIAFTIYAVCGVCGLPNPERKGADCPACEKARDLVRSARVALTQGLDTE